MSAAFVNQLRSGRPPIEIASGAGSITFRVEVAELWDAARVVAMPDTPVSEVKRRVMAALLPNVDHDEDYVLKLHGWELLDQHATLRDSGIVEGSVLLLNPRRRRPVR